MGARTPPVITPFRIAQPTDAVISTLPSSHYLPIEIQRATIIQHLHSQEIVDLHRVIRVAGEALGNLGKFQIGEIAAHFVPHSPR